MLVNRYLKRVLLFGTGTLLAIALAACDSGNSTPTTTAQPTAAIVATATSAALISTATVTAPANMTPLPTAVSTANATVDSVPSAVGTFVAPVLTTEPQLTTTP